MAHSRTPTISAALAGLRADYAMSQESRFRRRRPGVNATGGSADLHYAASEA